MLNLLLALHLFFFHFVLSEALEEEIKVREMSFPQSRTVLHSVEEPLSNFVSDKRDGTRLSNKISYKKTDQLKSKNFPAAFRGENRCAIVYIYRCDNEYLNLLKISRDTNPRSPPSATA